jgi:hypothetical protein
MKRADLDKMRKWFDEYCGSFSSPEREVRENLSLKKEHTFRVCRNIVRIAGEESMGGADALLAEAVALLHDVGRFPQYLQYRTFQDSVSVNHGELGARVLKEQGVLYPLPRAERELVLTAVKYHNTFKLPDLDDRRAVHLIKLIKDADKLDIWNVFLEYLKTPPGQRSPDICLNLPDTPGCSLEALSIIRDGRVIALSSLRSLNDLKLMLLSWMYDLHFRGSYRMLVENGYMDKIASELPRTGDIAGALMPLRDFLKRTVHRQGWLGTDNGRVRVP